MSVKIGRSSFLLKITKNIIRSMIEISDSELNSFLQNAKIKIANPLEILNPSGRVTKGIYFINTGILRGFIIDTKGTEHFVLKDQFISDSKGFMTKTASVTSLQALDEKT